MGREMSNALHTILGVSDGGAGLPELLLPPVGQPILTLAAIGLCVLAVWVLRRLIRPDKLKLTICPSRSNCLNPAHLFLVFATAIVANYLARVVGQSLLDCSSTEVAVLSSVCQSAFSLVAGLAVASLAFRNGASRGMGFNSRRWLNDSIRAVIAYLAVLPLCEILRLAAGWTIVVLLSQPERFVQQHVLLKALSTVAAPWQVLAIVSAVILAPLAEEVFFRGLVQSMLRRYCGNAWIAILITSALFALVHWQQLHAIPALFVLSVALGYNYERTGRLHAPILIHVFFNAMYVIEHIAKAQ